MFIEPIYNAVLVSVGMLAVANLFYSAFARNEWSLAQKNIACGLMFSTCAIMVMANSIVVSGVFHFDARNVFVVIGAAYGGPFAALICTVLVGGFRLFQGGDAAVLGACAVALVAGLSALWGHLMHQEYTRPALAPLIVLGMIASLPLAFTPDLPLNLSQADVLNVAVILTFANIALVLMFGCLMARETRMFDKEKLLEAEAKTDGLTGLLNRRSFNYDLARALKAKETFSILLIDLDHFKKINDKHGHDSGDAVLVECARVFKNAVRASDPVYRIGGEEFAVLLRYSTPEIAHLIAISITQATRREPIWFHNKSIPVTASIGVVTGAAYANCTIETDIARLLKQADVALYRAKTSGRDQAVVFGSDDPAQQAMAA